MSWLEDKYAKNWFDQIGNERTQRNYLRTFPKFLEFTNKTPTEIIQSRLEHLISTNIGKRQYWEQEVIKYMHSLEEEGLKSTTIHSYLVSTQSFFSRNGVKLQFARGQLKPEPTEEEKTSRKWVLKNEGIRKLYRHAKTPRDRTLMLVMYQSGFLHSDVTNMRIENFNFYDNEGNWQIPEEEHYYHFQMREKTNIYQCTCLSYEALADLRMMLKERGNPKEGALFVSFRDKPLDAREINLALKSIVERAFPDKTKDWKTKNLRDSYMIGLLAGQVVQELKDIMVGHQRQGARKHYGSPEALEVPIREAYKSAFKYLAINGFGTPSHKIDLLEKEFKENYSELAKLIAKQQTQIEHLEDTLNNQYFKTIEAIKKVLQSKGITFTEEFEEEPK